MAYLPFTQNSLDARMLVPLLVFHPGGFQQSSRVQGRCLRLGVWDRDGRIHKRWRN